MEGMSIAYSEDRRYDDASVVDFDAETINFDAETVNFEPEHSLPAALPPASAFHDDYEEEDLQQLNNRRGKWKYVSIALFGLLAAAALAITLTLFLGQGKESTVSSVKAGANTPSSAASSVDAPSLQPSMLRSYPPTFRGTDTKVTDGPTPTFTSSPTAVFDGTAAPSQGNLIEECASNGVCSKEESTCAIGKETCCGVTYDSIKCECSSGQWLCMVTDACNRPDCEETTVPTSDPASSGSIQTDSPTITIQTPQAKPTPLPSKKPSVSPSFQPSFKPTQAPSSASPITNEPTTAQPSVSPIQSPSTSPVAQPSASPTTNEPTTAQPSISPTQSPSSSPSAQPFASLSEKKYCVNIKFTSDNYPKDNGFTFQSNDKDTGEVLILLKEKEGFMKDSQTEYPPFQICDLSAGSYELVVTDVGGDGMTLRGNGSYVVAIDDTVVLVGGRFTGVNEISHEIAVGFDANMSETDEAFLLAHNKRRKNFHESQGVSYRPMAWSAELAKGASAWAKETAKTCNVELESGKYGQNAASRILTSSSDAHSPEDIVGWWAPENLGEEATPYDNKLTAVFWRSALYAGCASEVAQIENSNKFCQVATCRYVRTTNCGVNSATWLDFVLDENARLCNSVLCPGADENGDIVEGACHA